MITAIIQARMSSTRLPGKILMDVCGNSLLGHIIERLTYSRHISKIVVATTTSPADDVLADWLNKNGTEYFRGNELDVLNRYYEAAMFFNAEHVIRVTSDDPFKDPEIIDNVADLYLGKALDFACNNYPPTFAEGLDTEIFSLNALAVAERDAVDPFEREHVTQHFYKNPDKFKQANLASPVDFSHLRWTIDTLEDLLMTKVVYENLFKPGRLFNTADILTFLKARPEIMKINEGVSRSAMYNK